MHDDRPKTRRGHGGTRPSPDSDAEDRAVQARSPDYDVDYGRTPQHTRFKPGVSGNPNGRPPRSRNLKTILKQVLEESVEISVRGKLRRVSGIEALVRNTFVRSFKNDPKALAMLIAMIKQTGYGDDAAGAARDGLDGLDYSAILDDFLVRHGKERDEDRPEADGDPVKPDEEG